MKWFLSYSSAYEHLKVPFQQLLANIGYADSVDLFDGPDQDSVPNVVAQKIDASNAVLVLYGPHKKSITSTSASPREPARWPYEEVIYAHGKGKPLLFVCHEGTRMPEMLMNHQTPPRFNFWDSDAYLLCLPNIVGHIVTFRQKLELQSTLQPLQPFKFSRVALRNHVVNATTLHLEVYHELEARSQCSQMVHFIDNQINMNVLLPPVQSLRYDFETRESPRNTKANLRWGQCSSAAIQYLVDFSPPLKAGEKISYWRRFYLPNHFPLRIEDIQNRDPAVEFPPAGSQMSYGDPFDITYEVEVMRYSLVLPRSAKIANAIPIVQHFRTKEINEIETTRAKSSFSVVSRPEDADTVLELSIQRPILNHSYFIMYALDQ